MSKKQQGAMFRACVCAALLDATETWAMSNSTFTVLRNAFHAFVRPLNFKTMWDCERTTELLDRLGIPDLETMEINREQPRNAIDRQRRPDAPRTTATGGAVRLDATPATERRPDQAPGPPSQLDTTRPLQRPPTPRSVTGFTRTARTSTITSDPDPEHWHIVAQDRAACKLHC